MSDPLQESPAHPNVTSLKFAKLHSPKMKSVYWRYFGFPTNEDNCIITKQNVVCTICHKVLTNHGNTTNLRAHLQYRHKDIFNQVVQENNIRVPPRKPQAPKSSTIPAGIKARRLPNERKAKIKVEYTMPPSQHSSMSNEESAGNDEQAILYESVVPMTYDDDDVIDSNHFTKIEVSSANDIKSSPCSDLLDVNNRNERKFCINGAGIVTNELTMDGYQLLEALTTLAVNDIRCIDSLYDEGMIKFIRTLCGNIPLPSIKKIETYVKEIHSDKHTTLADQIKVHSQIKPYSLGFEIWTNIEQKNYLSVYFNYTTDGPDYNLINQIYCTIEYNKFTEIDVIFEDFNLQNCTVAVINCDYDEYLKHFLSSKNIPVTLSYDTIVNHCINNVIALPAVSSLIDEIKDTLMRYNLEISSKEVEIPTICVDFPWTYYELLKFFSETLSWPDDVEALVSSCKIVYDILSTLSVTLDTLRGEEIPLSSMLSPITAKVLNKKLAVTDSDDHFVETIKTTISDTLEKFVLSDLQLTISALLDPRFHRLINVNNNFSTCVQILTAKYDRIIVSQGISPTKPLINSTPISGKPSASSSIAKKSNLELFFDLTEGPVEQPVAHEPSSVETDLKRYRADVYATLDESPFLWWSKKGHMYVSLKHLATQYQCVPCVFNMNYKKTMKQQIMEYHKRHMLTGNLIDAILFLHYN